MAQAPSISGIISPAQLFLGPHDMVMGHAEQYVQKIVCPHGGCNVCFTCEQVRKRQHHSIVWISPEKSYTLDDLDIIFETTTLALDTGNLFFFILDRVELLTPSCSNKLLKMLEEPPHGYHFILCAEQSGTLLATIKSRCTVIALFGEEYKKIHESLLPFFTAVGTNHPAEFLKEVDASKINELESAELLDQIIDYWAKKYKGAVQEQDHFSKNLAEKKVELFTRSLLQLPMPGSSKIFWKNLFLQNGSIE